MSTGELSLAEAEERVDAALAPARLPAETVPVRAALNRVLAAPVCAALDLPPFPKSAMDGYALAAGDEREQYRLIGTVAAGQAPPPALAPGETRRVMTGAPVPPNTGMVVMQEDVTVTGATVTIHTRRGPNFCPRGEDVQCGAEVLAAGRILGPIDLANLIACGVMQVPVVRRVQVAILTTGDELAETPADLRPGRIMNSNGPLLAALCAGSGFAVQTEVRVPDDLGATRQALATALAKADLVLLSGGVSVGLYDLVPAALAAVGVQVHFAGVAVKPGRPVLFATHGACGVFGLPGNPVSVLVMYQVLVLRAARALTGGDFLPRCRRLPLAAAYTRRRGDRLELVPADVDEHGQVAAAGCHGSAHLLGLTGATGFFLVPAGVTALPAGALVESRWPWGMAR